MPSHRDHDNILENISLEEQWKNIMQSCLLKNNFIQVTLHSHPTPPTILLLYLLLLFCSCCCKHIHWMENDDDLFRLGFEIFYKSKQWSVSTWRLKSGFFCLKSRFSVGKQHKKKLRDLSFWFESLLFKSCNMEVGDIIWLGSLGEKKTLSSFIVIFLKRKIWKTERPD